MRLFVAVDPPEPVLDLLRELERPQLAQLRWTTDRQWHVTLRFLGEVDHGALPELVAALDTVPDRLAGTAQAIEAVVGPAVAWFPGRRVLQLPVAGLDRLALAVAEATAGWGGAGEPHFRGHLTLARTRGDRPGPLSLAGAPFVASWDVGELVLYASALGRGGSVYDAQHRVRLAGPAA